MPGAWYYPKGMVRGKWLYRWMLELELGCFCSVEGTSSLLKIHVLPPEASSFMTYRIVDVLTLSTQLSCCYRYCLLFVVVAWSHGQCVCTLNHRTDRHQGSLTLRQCTPSLSPSTWLDVCVSGVGPTQNHSAQLMCVALWVHLHAVGLCSMDQWPTFSKLLRKMLRRFSS